jgi:hypothetical protein
VAFLVGFICFFLFRFNNAVGTSELFIFIGRPNFLFLVQNSMNDYALHMLITNLATFKLFTSVLENERIKHLLWG